MAIETELCIEALVGLHVLKAMLERVDLRGSHDDLPRIILLVLFCILLELKEWEFVSEHLGYLLQYFRIDHKSIYADTEPHKEVAHVALAKEVG